MTLCRPVAALLSVAATLLPAAAQQPRPRRNVILFVADGLRRHSVTDADMPTFARLRREGVDLANSHSVFPTFTTANASAIATGHGLGDTGDFSNTLFPGRWLTRPDGSGPGFLTPFLENDEVLADMNAAFAGNYLGERTLLAVARDHGFAVASVGKLGPTAIQQNELVGWDAAGHLTTHGAVIVDDSTGAANGLPLPPEILQALAAAHLAASAPNRTNGADPSSQQSNARIGDAQSPGTLAPNRVQQQWFADVVTQALLPSFAAADKPFLLLFWSRDPDGSQHNQGDSLQQLAPGINGDTSRAALRNADHDLAQLLDWLDQHPAIKANTDVLLTSDHGFATISRREIAPGIPTAAPSAQLTYIPAGKDKPEPAGTLPSGMLAVDLALALHTHAFDANKRTPADASAFAPLDLTAEHPHYPSNGSAILADRVTQPDASDALALVAANGGSDLIYLPQPNTTILHSMLEALAHLDYVAGLFVDNKLCPTPAACPGALPLSAIRLSGSSKVPRPAIVVNFKHFYRTPGDLQTGIQVSDTTLQQGQGMHGGLARDQTWNNMAAWGPDFKHGLVDPLPAGNIDLAPTIAHILGFDLPSVGSNKGRVLTEALAKGPKPAAPDRPKNLVSAPTASGQRTVLQFQQFQGVRYFDQGCLLATKELNPNCP